MGESSQCEVVRIPSSKATDNRLCDRFALEQSQATIVDGLAPRSELNRSSTFLPLAVESFRCIELCHAHAHADGTHLAVTGQRHALLTGHMADEACDRSITKDGG